MEDFIKGSSILSILPTILYVGFAQYKGRTSALNSLDSVQIQQYLSIPHESLHTGIAILYGISYYMMKKSETDDDVMIGGIRINTLMFGFITGLILSIIGRFGLDLPVKLFKMDSQSSGRVHLVAPILYMIIFVYVDEIIRKFSK